MTRETAIAMGLDGLRFLTAAPERLEAFLAQSGLTATDLRTRLDDAGLLAATLGFLLADDESVLAFSAEAGCDPRDVHLAQHVLENA